MNLFDVDVTQPLWTETDAFLGLAQREKERVEYREKLNPERFVETVAAMANAGGGTILLGVRETADDRPGRWPTLDVGEVKYQQLEALSRAHLVPYVALGIGSAEKPDGSGEVVVVRVPDVWPKPVWLST